MTLSLERANKMITKMTKENVKATRGCQVGCDNFLIWQIFTKIC